MHIGQIEITPLSDGTIRLDGGAMFGVVPKVLWERQALPDARNRIEIALRPLLIRTGGRNILVDAGIGDKLTPKEIEIYGVDRVESLDRSLARAGLMARDIDVVIATHLHFDHAGGFTSLVDGVLVPRFPRATYLIRRGEWEAATEVNERTRASYAAENFVPLAEAGVVQFIEEDGELLPGVSVWRTGGHTRDHQIVRISSGGRTAIFAADLLPTTAHLREAWIMGYDLYPMDTLAYKREFLREAATDEHLILFEHDPRVAAGIIRADAKGRRVEPVDL
jgi:glyoxylase-like metal-dependent hydrolase (beta-lactamase superfamily II)